ncbi:MAG TPA: cytochrome c peroxidase [Vicinamibacteria bacterium]
MRTVSQQRRRFTGVVALLVLVTSGRAHLSASNVVAPVPEPYASEILTTTTSSPWTPEMAALGKRLFFDPRLSRDGSVSCATCHDPKRAFTDGVALARGIRGQVGPRNTPTILNRGVGRLEFWDGRAGTLEDQALGPIQAKGEMDLTIEEAVARLRQEPSYREAFQAVYGGEPSAERLARAIAAYERTVSSIDSAFDRFLAGDQDALPPDAQRGLVLFGGKARCGECHSGPNFSDELFHTLGLGTDPGRGAVTKVASETGAFKTPTLREITSTAPYMHDGSIATLEEVVEYYDRGGTPHPNLSPKMTRLGLTEQERRDLVAFLRALSGTIVEVPGSTGTQEASSR